VGITNNDFGDLLGTSDARGCGVNYHYDVAGRLLSEDYSPCEPHHSAYTTGNAATMAGMEVVYEYGDLGNRPTGITTPSGYSSQFSAGRLAAVHDRGASTFTTSRSRDRDDHRRAIRPAARPSPHQRPLRRQNRRRHHRLLRPRHRQSLVNGWFKPSATMSPSTTPAAAPSKRCRQLQHPRRQHAPRRKELALSWAVVSSRHRRHRTRLYSAHHWLSAAGCRAAQQPEQPRQQALVSLARLFRV
jgi:YD repeat-containing protein